MATGYPPLTDRSLKYGRNVIAVSSVIVVLAWVPEIDFKSFRPFGLTVTDKGELSVWAVMFAVLIYYVFSFGFAAAIDINKWMMDHDDPFTDVRNAKKTKRNQLRTGQEVNSSVHRTLRKTGPMRHSRLRLWCLDVGFPVTMFVLACFAVVPRVLALFASQPH